MHEGWLVNKTGLSPRHRFWVKFTIPILLSRIISSVCGNEPEYFTEKLLLEIKQSSASLVVLESVT